MTCDTDLLWNFFCENFHVAIAQQYVYTRQEVFKMSLVRKFAIR